MVNANFLNELNASFNHKRFLSLLKSRLNGQTRMQIAQSEESFAQKEKHFSAFEVHFLTPFIAETFGWSVFGGPKGSALTGQASAHLVHVSQNARTPVCLGLSCAKGIFVNILENLSRGPNSGVITIWFLAYSPNPALIANGITRAVSFIDGTASYPKFLI